MQVTWAGPAGVGLGKRHGQGQECTVHVQALPEELQIRMLSTSPVLSVYTGRCFHGFLCTASRWVATAQGLVFFRVTMSTFYKILLARVTLICLVLALSARLTVGYQEPVTAEPWVRGLELNLPLHVGVRDSTPEPISTPFQNVR